MKDSAAIQNELCERALDAENAGQLKDAAQLFRQAIVVDKRNPVPYLFLGYTLQSAQDLEAATMVWSLAADLDSRIINAWRSAATATEIRERSRSANERLRGHFTALHRDSVEEYRLANPGADVSRIASAIWCQTHDQEFEYRDPDQQPQLFFVPELTPIAVYDDSHMPWRNTLECASDAIREEFTSAWERAATEQRPYLEADVASLGDDWKSIAGTLNWGSLHLYKKGEPNQHLIDLFPVTLATLANLPLIEASNGPSEILFSVLQGGQRIPPHYGVSNTDMTVHLPIVTTPDSAIRVVNEICEWQQGQVFAFDDAFEHESWNNSDQPRVNLLFETWHPELTEHERSAVRATFAARDRWNRSRHI